MRQTINHTQMTEYARAVVRTVSFVNSLPRKSTDSSRGARMTTFSGSQAEPVNQSCAALSYGIACRYTAK
jgi:hypothetical protein